MPEMEIMEMISIRSLIEKKGWWFGGRMPWEEKCRRRSLPEIEPLMNIFKKHYTDYKYHDLLFRNSPVMAAIKGKPKSLHGHYDKDKKGRIRFIHA